MSEQCKPLSESEVKGTIEYLKAGCRIRCISGGLSTCTPDVKCKVRGELNHWEAIAALQSDLRIHRRALDLAGTELLARTKTYPMGHRTFSDMFLDLARKMEEEK